MRKDLIPTVEEVRDDFMMTQAKYKNVHVRVASDKFYAWLDERDAKVAKATEERIIKVLEDRIISMSAHHSRLDEQEGLIRAIALIKGENK